MIYIMVQQQMTVVDFSTMVIAGVNEWQDNPCFESFMSGLKGKGMVKKAEYHFRMYQFRMHLSKSAAILK